MSYPYRQVNDISSRYLDENGKQLVFAVKKGTDSTLLWRATVRVAAVKVDADSKRIESCKTLPLKKFVPLYNRLRNQADAVAAAKSFNLCHQLDKEEDIAGAAAAVDECIICLERKPELILPCAHSYCLPCIEQWSVSHRTCPVCRQCMEGGVDDGWVSVAGGPDSLEIATEIQKSLMSLSN